MLKTCQTDQDIVHRHVLAPFLDHFVKVHSKPGLLAADLCHPTRFLPAFENATLVAKEWGRPKLLKDPVVSATSVRRELVSRTGHRLSITLAGENLKFVTLLRLDIDGLKCSGELVPMADSTDAELRVSAEVITKRGESLSSRQMTVKLLAHFELSGSRASELGWTSHLVVLPDDLKAEVEISKREARIAGLMLGELLNEAVIHCALHPDDSTMLELLRKLELDPKTTTEARYTETARKNYADVVTKVTDPETGVMLPGVEALLTFAVTTEQVLNLGKRSIDGKGANSTCPDVASFVSGICDPNPVLRHIEAT